MSRKLAIFFCILILSSCGRPPLLPGQKLGYTNVQLGDSGRSLVNYELDKYFDVSRLGESWKILTAPTYNAVVFALDSGNTNARGRAYFSAADMTSSKSWLIPNGSYYFSMIGYDSADMGSAPKCAQGADGGAAAGTAITLTGGSKSITLTGGSCGVSSPFKDANSYSNISFAVCASSTDISALASNSPCGTAPATVRGLRVFIHQRDEFTNQSWSSYESSVGGPKLNSACVPISTAGGSEGVGTGSVNYLGGNTNYATSVRLRTEIVTYTDTTCSTATGIYIFESGLASAGVAGFKVYGNAFGSDPSVDRSTKARWVAGASPRLFLKEY